MTLQDAYIVYEHIQKYGIVGLESTIDRNKRPRDWELTLALGVFNDCIKELEAKLNEGEKHEV